MNGLRRAMVALAALCAAAMAGAHTSGASFIALRTLDATHVRATYDFDLRDLNQLLELDANLDGELTWGEIDRAAASIEQTILARTRLTASDACEVKGRAPIALAEHGDGPFARLVLNYSCHDGASRLSLDLAGWFDFDPGHRSLLEYQSAHGRITQTLLSQSAPTWRVTEPIGHRLQRFLVEGAHHLLIGYDHLAFLGVLLLAIARRPSLQAKAAPLDSLLKRALIVITAFTAAHSLTLALAATDTLVLPSKPVEISIAASVVLAAVLNLWRGAGDHGWKLAFAFGLVHGLGFAGALADMASGGIDLLALAAFNFGIEVAQIAVAAVTVPFVWLTFRNAHTERIALPAMSLAVAVMAGSWVVARI